MRTPPRERIAGIDGKCCRIVKAAAPGMYVLFDSEGVMRASHQSPRWLSESALFMSNAESVRWDFSLVGVEE